LKAIYEKFKGQEINGGKICGYNDTKLVVCREQKEKQYKNGIPDSTFRKYDKEHFIEQEFKDAKYRYFYINESELSDKVKLMSESINAKEPVNGLIDVAKR
jgi:hypothetical protein